MEFIYAPLTPSSVVLFGWRRLYRFWRQERIESEITNEKKQKKIMPTVVIGSVHSPCHIVSQTAVHSDESHIAVSDKCVKPSVHL